MIFEGINLERRLAETLGLIRSERLDSVAKDLAMDMLVPIGEVDPLLYSLSLRKLKSVMAIAQVGLVFETLSIEPKAYRNMFFAKMDTEDTVMLLDRNYTTIGVSMVKHGREVAAFVVLARLADTTDTGEAVPTLAGEPWPVDSLISRENALFDLTNKARTEHGLGTVMHDPHLTGLARKYAARMFEIGFFAHEDPAGLGFADRVIASNMTKYTAWGENLASLLNPKDPPEDAHLGLMNSPSHRRNILTPTHTHLGVGAATDGNWWIFVQLFARE
jgi:hypothetical protein